MTIDVVFISYKAEVPPDSYWDQQMIKDLFSKEMWSWSKQYDFKIRYDFKDITGGAIVVMPARNQVDRVDNLNADIALLPWCIVMLTGDEESLFPFEKITHPNWKLWVMSPRPDRHKDARYLGSGYTPHTRSELKKHTGEKSINWFLSAQMNHNRRLSCAAELDGIQDRIPGELYRTPGFIQGMDPSEYYYKIARSLIAPAPCGGYTPDSFRLFEALEAGCIPIADEECVDYVPGLSYWGWFFGEAPPFPLIHDYHGTYEYIRDALIDGQRKANKVFAWWQKKKREMAYNLRKDIKELSGIDFTDPITVIIPTSTIPSHPSTEIIEKCIEDVRKKLPESEIIIMIDGLSERFPERRDIYTEYTRRLLWKCNFQWKNVLPLVFDTPTHQVGMTREALTYVTTPAILFVEHDAPLCPDPEFTYPWDSLVSTIMRGDANVVRFHHEASILPESKHLLLGEVELVDGVSMVKTSEWSQRPHLARTEFYREMLRNYFLPDAFGMIEDHIYGKCLNACKDNGLMGWYSWRVWIFHPEGDNIKRSYTLDGRKEDPKYDEDYVY